MGGGQIQRNAAMLLCDLEEMNIIFIGVLVHPGTVQEGSEEDRGIVLLFLEPRLYLVGRWSTPCLRCFTPHP